jgi:hypothetical protein
MDIGHRARERAVKGGWSREVKGKTTTEYKIKTLPNVLYFLIGRNAKIYM